MISKNCLHNTVFTYAVNTVGIRKVEDLTFLVHSILSAGNHATAGIINSLYDKVNLTSKYIAEDFTGTVSVLQFVPDSIFPALRLQGMEENSVLHSFNSGALYTFLLGSDMM